MERNKMIEFLSSYRRAFKAFADCAERIALLREKQMAAASPSLSGLPRGGANIDLSDYVVKLEVQVDDCKQKKEKARDQMRAVKNVIENIYDTTDRHILNYRYLDFMNFSEIAELMGINKSTVSRRHDDAVARLCKTVSI